MLKTGGMNTNQLITRNPNNNLTKKALNYMFPTIYKK